MWRTQKQRYSLQAEVCSHCSSAVFPPRAVCPYCKIAMRAQVALPGTAARETVVAAEYANQGREFIYALPAPAMPLLVAAAGDD
jgi:uncharacterized OB-fold protein